MKIALMQLDCENSLWNIEGLLSLLKQTKGADLVVFPECMPLYEPKGIPHEKAIQILSEAGEVVRGSTFIAGGYVKDGKCLRNRVYLVNRGKVTDWYDKQIVWSGESFTPGTLTKCFEWEGNRCIPLICADAGDELTPRKVSMMSAALDAGAGKNTPIIVCSYGGGLLTDYWQPALREWSKGCNAPVVICGIAGTDNEEIYLDKNGGIHAFGGGGSGAFWSNGREKQFGRTGIVFVDLESKEVTWKAFREIS